MMLKMQGMIGWREDGRGGEKKEKQIEKNRTGKKEKQRFKLFLHTMLVQDLLAFFFVE